MGQIWWQIKQLASKLITILLVGAVGFAGFSLYKEGAFRGGFTHAGKTILRKVPYVGSRFRHFFASSPQGRSRKNQVSYRSSRKKGVARHKKYSHRRHRNQQHRRRR